MRQGIGAEPFCSLGALPRLLTRRTRGTEREPTGSAAHLKM